MANLDVIRTLTLKAQSQGFGQAQQAVTSLTQAVASLQRQFNQGVNQTQNFARVQQQLSQVLGQVPQAQNAANNALGQTRNALVPATNNFTQLSSATKQSRYELLNFSRQMNDVVVGLASGQAVFTIFVQQGSQIFDIFQTASASGRSFSQVLLSVITPGRVLIGVLGLLAVAAVTGAVAWKNYAKQLDDTAKIMGTTIDEANKLTAAAAFKGISAADLQSGITTFSEKVNEARQGVGDLAVLFRANGVAVGNTTESLGRLADLIMRAKDNTQLQFSILRQAGLPATLEWVRLLEQGAAGLQRLKDSAAEFAANKEMVQAARDFDEALTKGWTNFVINAKNSIVIVGSFLTDLGTRAGEAIRGAVLPLLQFSQEALRNAGLSVLRGGMGKPLVTDTSQIYGPGFGPQGGPLQIRVGGRPAPAPIDPNISIRQMSLENQRIGLLGNLATVEEKVRAKQNELNIAGLQGAGVDAKRAKELQNLVVLQEKARISSAVVSSLGDLATLTEEYTERLDRLNIEMAEHNLTQEQYARGLIAIKTGMQDVRQFSATFASGAVTSLSDIATGAKDAGAAFKDFGNQVLASLTQMILKITVFNQLEKSLTAGIGQLLPGTAPTTTTTTTSSVAVGVGHSGGVIGSDAFASAVVDLAHWKNAPRFQSGGMVSGVPILAHAGEGVFTPGQMAALGKGGNQVVNVNVENAPSTPHVEQSRGPGGSLNVNLVFDQFEGRLADNMRRGKGPLTAATGGRFGLNPARGNALGGA